MTNWSKRIHEVVAIQLAYRFPGDIPPSLEDIRSTVKHRGLPSEITPEEILKAWHWVRIQHTPAFGVIYSLALAYRQEGKVLDELHEEEIHNAIHAYLEDRTKGALTFQAEEQRLSYRRTRELNGHTSTLEREDNFIHHSFTSHMDSVKAALELRPEDVLKAWKILKKHDLFPFGPED